jgi:hypothetical protein
MHDRPRDLNNTGSEGPQFCAPVTLNMSMRLINTSTYKFAIDTVSLAAGARDYAIVSHTWGSGEISFQELLAIEQDATHRSATKAGYLKVRGACDKARSAGHDHIWIDTCCIDKTSSTELSEAINSMYRWYKEARVCFVYLEDVEVSKEVAVPALEQCRWFTRGWCLQELIAPKEIEFCDKHWTTIGSKVTLAERVAKITRISSSILMNSSLVESVPVAQRMAWAAGRNTTRKEDEAYCMLGIFGITMPLLYGEGSQAFRRLQEQIITKNNDMSIFIPGSPQRGRERSRFQGLFADSPKDFQDCGYVTHTAGQVVSTPAFTLTNRGLHFKHLELDIERSDAMYSLRLNCESQNRDHGRIYLRKVGPALYARSANIPTQPSEHPSGMQIEEAYVVVEISDFIYERLERCLEHVIQVKSNTHNLAEALQVVTRLPRSNTWDPSGMQFLTEGVSPFTGIWKLFPGLAQGFSGGEHVQPMAEGHIYLACGLNTEGDTPPTPWTRFFSLAQWRKLETTHGVEAWRKIIKHNSPSMNHMADTIELGAESTGRLKFHAIITSSVNEKGVLGCTLTVDIEEKRLSAQNS